MQSYIALIRGINVGGQKTILMKDLKSLFESMRFKDVSTFIQSGNILFKSPKRKPSDLAEEIEQGILKKFSFEVSVVVRTPDDLAKVVAANPFSKRKLLGEDRVYITYLSATPAKGSPLLPPPNRKTGDEFKLIGSEVFILCKAGYHKTIFSNAFIEKSLGLKSTTRNLETTCKLLELGNQMA